MLNIYYGRENIDKEKFIFEHIQDRALIIVPDQFTLEMERRAFAQLHVKGLMDVEVISMSRLGYRLLAELGGSKKSFIDKYGRHMILAKTALEEKDNLKVFRGLENRNSFIEMVNNFISELKQYNCKADDLQAVMSVLEPESYTFKKMEDLYLLFSRYEENIAGKYTDSEDYIDLFLNKIKDSQLIRDNNIWLYGFDSFAPKALSVIGQLTCYAKDVNVVLTYAENCGDEELFQLSGTVISNLKEIAETVGEETHLQTISNEYLIEEKAHAMKHIERELYALPCKKSNDSQGLTLVAAANFYNEAESAAAYVLHLIRDENLRLRDIKIICNDQETRGEILIRVFNEYGLELFSDAKRSVMSSPVVQYIISLLDVVIEKYRFDTIFKILKSGFSDLTFDEITDLENYGIKYRIKGSMWKRPFTRGEKEYKEEGLNRLNDIRERAIKPLEPLETIFKARTVEEFITRFYDYLYNSVLLPDRIMKFIKGQEAALSFDMAQETAQIWTVVVGILDQISEIMGSEKFEGEGFRDILNVGLSQVEVGVLPPTQDGLVMGTMQRSRSSDVKALIVVGANEGLLPQESSQSTLFSSEEKELFKEQGHELCKVDSVKQQEERLGIYRNLSKPVEHLWVSYSTTKEDGNEASPSEIFTKLQDLFDGIKVQKDILNSDNSMELVNDKISGLRHLTEALQQKTQGQQLPDVWQDAINWYKLNKPEALRVIRNGIGFTNQQKELGEKVAEALYKEKTDEFMSLSPSRIEKFSRCPFAHFISYGLNPEERRIFEVAPREIGDLYHRCIRDFATELTQKGIEVSDPDSPWLTLSREDSDNLVNKVFEKELSDYREGVFKLGNEEIYRSKRALNACREVCWSLVKQVRAGKIVDSRFEIPFKRNGSIPPLEIDLGDKKVLVEGTIDRVDYLPGNRVKIIDYKTGNESFDIDEAKAGYRLQLPIYLQAALAKDKKPAGVFYFKIAEPMLSVDGKMDAEKRAEEIFKGYKLNGVMVDNPSVINSIAGNFSTNSDVVHIKFSKKNNQVEGSSSGALISEEEFLELQEIVVDRVTEACKNLSSGTVDIHPMKTSKTSACAYCLYKGICRFDTAFEGCKFNII